MRRLSRYGPRCFYGIQYFVPYQTAKELKPEDVTGDLYTFNDEYMLVQ